MKKTQGMFAVFCAIAALGIMHAANAADLTGTWIMDVKTSAGSGSPTFTFTQKGNVLTGTYKGQLGEAPVSGTVEGDEVSWEFQAEAQGIPMKVTYTGKVSGKSVSGKVALGQFAEGTFTGNQQ